MNMRDDSDSKRGWGVGDFLCTAIVVFAFGYMAYHVVLSLL